MTYRIINWVLAMVLVLPLSAQIGAEDLEMEFSKYLRGFDYQERKDMKINLSTLLDLYQQGKVEIIDIRFPEEYQAWQVSIARNIPLNELPDRLGELDRSKLNVTVCPHYDRAAIARHYLTLQGYESKYLVEGLLGLTDYLRGDRAKDFMRSIHKN